MSNAERITSDWYERNRLHIHSSTVISESDLADVEYMHAQLLMGLDPVPMCQHKPAFRLTWGTLAAWLLLGILSWGFVLLIVLPIYELVRIYL